MGAFSQYIIFMGVMKSKMLGVDFVKMAGPPSQLINNQPPSLRDIASDYLKYVCVKFCNKIIGV